jgi:hypothetical protein
MVGAVAKDQQLVSALGDVKLLTLDACKGFECRTGGAPALAAVAVQRVDKGIGHRVVHRAAQALAVQSGGVVYLMAWVHGADRVSLEL